MGKKQISLEITTDQYIALLKGYEPDRNRRYGILYNHWDRYFYAHRSGGVVGKCRFEKNGDTGYCCSEMYDNPEISDCEVIFHIVREACRHNKVKCDDRKIIQMEEETECLIEILENRITDETSDYLLSPSDPPFTAKARKLQSMWRIENRLEPGCGPTRN